MSSDLHVYRYQLRDGHIQGDILRILENIKNEYAKSPYIREFLYSVLGQLDDNDKDTQIEKITDFVKFNLIYVRDPLGVEYVISPVRHIKRILTTGYSTGDCDDHALFLNTLLSSVGLKTRFVGVKLNSEKFNHVISCVHHKDRWIDIDPCAKKYPQREYDEQLTFVN